METDGETAEADLVLPKLFPVSDASWLQLRTFISTTADLDFMEWIYDQLGECELQLAYTLHVHEQRMADLKS